MKQKTIFITGATGFLGSHLVYEMLKMGHRIIALSRKSKSNYASPMLRVIETLKAIDENVNISRNNLIVIEGDVTNSGDELFKEIINNQIDYIDEVWHCVATFKIKEKDIEEIKRINIEGCRNMLNLVVMINQKMKSSCRYFHVSTAYSSGRKAKPIEEKIQKENPNFRSLYEWSKNQSELLIETYQKDYNLDITILRPSIIIGAKKNKVLSRAGYYQFCEELYTLKKRFEVNMGSSFDGNIDVRFICNANICLNLVPMDYITNSMLALANKKELVTNELKIFNIINENAPNIGEVQQLLCKDLRISGFNMIEEEEFNKNPPSPLEKLFDRKLVFQAPYMREDVRFSNENFRKHLTFDEIPTPIMDENFLHTINEDFFKALQEVFNLRLKTTT
ncbi:MAG: NAD-dependent epimerase/dehydratase family protein [Bacteroidales bacterium]|nr:NAD-dependent epimerase/dehydratase family protein [Bacteroidales bacterium]